MCECAIRHPTLPTSIGIVQLDRSRQCTIHISIFTWNWYFPITIGKTLYVYIYYALIVRIRERERELLQASCGGAERIKLLTHFDTLRRPSFMCVCVYKLQARASNKIKRKGVFMEIISKAKNPANQLRTENHYHGDCYICTWLTFKAFFRMQFSLGEDRNISCSLLFAIV